jgi:hypothetical protein
MGRRAMGMLGQERVYMLREPKGLGRYQRLTSVVVRERYPLFPQLQVRPHETSGVTGCARQFLHPLALEYTQKVETMR